MEIITEESLFDGANISLVNTRQRRYNNVRFSAEVKDGKYIITSENGILELTIYDEIILAILLKFRFAPSWLVMEWYDSIREDIKLFPEDEGYKEFSLNRLRDLINVGFVYEFPSAVSMFLMPTEKLASIFGERLGGFNNPPYNTLTHTISEQQIMFDCLSGKAKYLEGINCIPYVSSLGLDTVGAMCIPELDYSVRNSYFKNHIQEFNDQEAILIQEMLDGKIITTPDLKESKFTIHKKIDQYDYEMKIPDLVVLAPRVLDEDEVAVPRSIALEVELSCKGVEAYKNILNLYWSNLKYGKVVYLLNDPKIRSCLIEAYNWVKYDNELRETDQTCEFEIVEFEVPYNRRQLVINQ